MRESAYSDTGLKLVANYVTELKRDNKGNKIFQRFLKWRADRDNKGYADNIKNFVSRTIRKARRANIWWKFSSAGKKFLGLVVKMPITFRSTALLKALQKTLNDLLLLLNPVFKYYAAGYETARSISEIAYTKWGISDALNWMRERSFAICWGMFKHAQFSNQSSSRS